MRKLIAAVLAAGLVACAAPPEGGEPAPAAADTRAGETAGRETLVEAGHGTLRQDEFTVQLRSGALLLKFTPLTESVIRLAAPDTYDRLHAIAQSRARDASAATGAPELFLGSFFSYQPDVTFQPEDVQITHQGRLLQPVRIIALTPGWGRQRLAQQETQSAIYVFEGPFDYQQPITVAYGMQRSDEWSRIIPRLQTEMGKVRARSGS